MECILRYLLCTASAAILAALCVLAAGCGGDDGSPVAAPKEVVSRSDISRAGRTKPAARLQRPESPEATVLLLWRYVQVGTFPLAPSLYHPRVAQRLTASRMVSAFRRQRTAFVGTKPRVLERERTELGELVRVQLSQPGSQPAEESFLLRRTGGRWLIIYDTVLAAALAVDAQAKVQARERDAPRDITPRAAAAGDRAAVAYGIIFAPRALRSLVARRRQRPPVDDIVATETAPEAAPER